MEGDMQLNEGMDREGEIERKTHKKLKIVITVVMMRANKLKIEVNMNMVMRVWMEKEERNLPNLIEY